MQQDPVSVHCAVVGSVAGINEPMDAPARVSPRHLTKLERALRLIVDEDPVRDPPFLIWLSGECGSGKTTLVTAAEALLGPERALFLHGEAFPTATEVLEPVTSALRGLLGRMRARAEAGDTRWARAWQEVLEAHAPALTKVMPELDWGRAITPYPALESRYERSRVLDHLAGVLLSCAEVMPTVLHLENAEHLDSLARELLQTLARVVRTRQEGRRSGLPFAPPPRLAVILSTDDNERCPIDVSEQETTQLVLRGLGREEFARYLEDELGAEIALSKREKLYQLTHGNPLDVQLRLLRERALNSQGQPEERVRRMIDFGRYDLEFAQQLTRLPAELVEIIQTLAAIGKPLSRALLSRVCNTRRELSDAQLDAALERLEREQWVRRRVRGGIELRCGRVRTVALEKLGHGELLVLHRACAEAIQEEYQARPNRRYREIYYHYARSGAPRELIVEAGFRAADESLGLYDSEGARQIYCDLLDACGGARIDQLSKGLVSLADLLLDSVPADEQVLMSLEKLIQHRATELEPETQAGLWRRIGDIAGQWQWVDRQMSYYQRGFAAVKDCDRSPERMKIYACLGRTCLERRELDDTMRYCRDGFKASQLGELTDDPEFLELCLVTQEVHFRRGEFVEARRFEEQYLRLAQIQGTPTHIVESLLRLSALVEQAGEHDQAQQLLLEAQPIARASGARLLEARVAERLGYFYARIGAWLESAQSFQGAFVVQSEIGDEQQTIRLLGALGTVAFHMGQAAEGARNFRLYALHQKVRVRQEVAPALPALPIDYRSRSERDEAIHVRQGILARVSNGASQHDNFLETCSELGDLLRDRGELELARATLRRGLRVAGDHGVAAARYCLQLGIIFRLQGEIEAALEAFQRGLNAMAQQPERLLVAEISVQVGLLQLHRGDYGRALSSLNRGLRTYLEHRHETGVAHVLTWLGEAFLLLGRREVAEELAQASLALSDALEVDRIEAEAWLLLSRIRSRDRLESAGHQEVATAREIFGELGILEGRCRVLLQEGELAQIAGDATRAGSLCQEALEIACDLGLSPLNARALRLRGAIEGGRRTHGADLPGAVRTLESALARSQALGDRALEMEVQHTFACMFHDRARPGVARSHLARAAEILQQLVDDCPEDSAESLRTRHPAAGLMRLYEMEAAVDGGGASANTSKTVTHG
ncbi:MAG: AAA family ATPase [Planctomycetota bacterium]